MSEAVDRLYALLPAIHRVRDAAHEPAGSEPLRALLSVLAEQLAVLDDDLAQRYDDQFIETCAEWVVPYIGDLLGYEPFSGPTDISAPRAEVARLLAARRRKGTAAMIEEVAAGISGWPAAAVELFQRLATTQYMNHIRRQHTTTPDLGAWEPLEQVGSPFDRIPRTADVRRMATGGGLYNIPNLAVFLWRTAAYRVTDADAAPLDQRRFFFHAAGVNTPLFTPAETERAVTHLATPANVPLAISRRMLRSRLADYYGPGRALMVSASFDNGLLEPIDIARVRVCNLSDKPNTSAWAHSPATAIAIDPELGRIAFPPGPVPTRVVVSYYYGFGMDIGGGEYSRPPAEDPDAVVTRVTTSAELSNALGLGAALPHIVDVANSGRYEAPAVITLTSSLTIRAADGVRPTLRVNGRLTILAEDESDITLDGLLVSGGGVEIPDKLPNGNLNKVRRVVLRHCTLTPAGHTSIAVAAATAVVEVDRCITGAMRVARTADVRVVDSIVDAGAEDAAAFAALDGTAAGGSLHVAQSTIVGSVESTNLVHASNAIFASDRLRSERKQRACLRFSYVPWTASVGRRYRCRPAAQSEERAVRPRFGSRRYGDPRYAELSPLCPAALRHGADDEGEMGAYHAVHATHRERNVRARVEEHLRFGLEAGVMLAPHRRGAHS